jgi:tetratricopeptide (TPR) repeat protein
MKKIIVLLCLGLIGCATAAKVASVTKEKENPPQKIEEPAIVNAAEMDSVISVFSEAIEKNPNYAGAYYNRAIAYFHKNNYEKCWQDVHKAEFLGLKFSPDFMAALKKASQTEN